MLKLGLAFIEGFLNHWIRRNSANLSLLKYTLDKKSIAIQSTFTLYLYFTHTGIELYSFFLTSTPDLYIQGSIKDLLTLFKNQSFSSKLKVQGDISLLQHLELLLKPLDWEELLSYFVGETVATPLHQKIKKSYTNLQTHTDKFKGNFQSYIQEELQILPSKVEMNYFYHTLNALAERLKLLEHTLNTLEKT